MDEPERLGLHTHAAAAVLIALGVSDVLVGGVGFVGLVAAAGGFTQEQGEYHAVGSGVAMLLVAAGLVVFVIAAAKGALAGLCGVGLQRRWSRVKIGGLAVLSASSYALVASLGLFVALDSREAFVPGMAVGVVSLGLAATVLGAAAVGSIRPKGAAQAD